MAMCIYKIYIYIYIYVCIINVYVYMFMYMYIYVCTNMHTLLPCLDYNITFVLFVTFVVTITGIF